MPHTTCLEEQGYCVYFFWANFKYLTSLKAYLISFEQFCCLYSFLYCNAMHAYYILNNIYKNLLIYQHHITLNFGTCAGATAR